MGETVDVQDYPPDQVYYLDWWEGSISFLHWMGSESGGFHGFDKYFSWHEGITPGWLQGTIFRMLTDYPWYCTCLELDGNTLEQMQRWTPDAVTELARWVRLGRIVIISGLYEKPYPFLHPGESQIRQFQYGRAATRDVLGIEVEYFGAREAFFHPQMAQILKLAGYKGVLLATGWGHYGYSPTAEEHRIWWEAPDGTRIDAAPAHPAAEKQPYGMHLAHGLAPNDPRQRELFAKDGSRWPLLSLGSDVGMCQEVLRLAEKALDRSYANDVAWYLGLDVRKIMRERIQKLIDWPRFSEPAKYLKTELPLWVNPDVYKFYHDGLKIRFTTPGEYFSRTPPPETRKAFGREDFRFRHFSGVYGDRLTRSAHHAESRLCDAEALSVMAQAAGGAGRAGQLDGAWKHLLNAQNLWIYSVGSQASWRLNEFPVSRGIRLATESAREAEAICEEAMTCLEQKIDTQARVDAPSAVACVVFNPLGWTRSDGVTVHVSLGRCVGHSVKCYDADVEVPCQVIKRYEGANHFLVEAEVAFLAKDIPGFGHKVYHFMPSESPDPVSEGTGSSLENDLLRVEFDANGHLTRCVDLVTGREFLDTSSYLGGELTGRFPQHGLVRSRSCRAPARVAENGPIRWTLHASGRMAGYPYETTICLTAGSRRIDFLTVFDFDCGARIGDLTWLSPRDAALPENDGVGVYNDHDKLRTTFNPRVRGRGRFVSDLAFAAYPSERQNVLGISWADYSDEEAGLTLINTGNIGYYHSPENHAMLSMVLAYGGPARGKCPTLLAGVNRFRYAVLPHDGDWKAAQSHRHAAELRHPLIARTAVSHEGDLPACGGLLEVRPANVLSSALVPGDPAVLRVVEMAGTDTVATLHLRKPVERARIVDLAGKLIREGRVAGAVVEFEMRGHEIATIQLPGIAF